MVRKEFINLLLYVILSVVNSSGVQQGFPPLPHAFFGRAYINGNPAPVGTQIEARGENVRIDITGNPIEVLVEGFYGSTDNTAINLVVQGDMTEGTPIEFYVNGQKAYCNDGSGWEESYPYQAGGITSLDLWLGALSTEAAIPTATRTPTFAPTVPRTATSTQAVVTRASSTPLPGATAAATDPAQPAPPIGAETAEPGPIALEATAGSAPEATPSSAPEATTGSAPDDVPTEAPTGAVTPQAESQPGEAAEGGESAGWLANLLWGALILAGAAIVTMLMIIIRRKNRRERKDEDLL